MILSQSNTFTCVLWEVVQLNRMTQHKNRELFFRKPRKLRLLHHLLAKPKDTIFKCWFHLKPKSQMIAKISKFRVAQLQHRELQTLSTPHTALHLPCPCPAHPVHWWSPDCNYAVSSLKMSYLVRKKSYAWWQEALIGPDTSHCHTLFEHHLRMNDVDWHFKELVCSCHQFPAALSNTPLVRQVVWQCDTPGTFSSDQAPLLSNF